MKEVIILDNEKCCDTCEFFTGSFVFQPDAICTEKNKMVNACDGADCDKYKEHQD
jgi:hypothetical protein